MVAVGERYRREEIRRIKRAQADLIKLGIVVALVALVALTVSCIMTAAEVKKGAAAVTFTGGKRTAETAKPEETVLVIPIESAGLWEPESMTPEMIIESAPPQVRYYLDEQERDMVERVVMAEAGAEDFDGKCLVALCILNTAEARNMTPIEVVTEKNQYTTPATTATSEVKRAVAAVFDDGYAVTDEPIRWFYAPRYSAGKWHENNLVFVLEHGGHRFFKEG